MAAAGLGPLSLARQDLQGRVIESPRPWLRPVSEFLAQQAPFEQARSGVAADNGGAAGDALACFTVQQPEEGSFSDSVHALKGIPLSQLGDKLDLEDYKSNAHKCRYNPEEDEPWMRELPNSPRSWPRNRSESLDVEGHTAQQGPGALRSGYWQAAGNASGTAAATAGGGVQLLQRPAALRGQHDELAAPPGPMVQLASLHVQYGQQSGSCSVEGSSAVKLTVPVPVLPSAYALAAFFSTGVEFEPEAPAGCGQPAMPAASLPCSPAGVLPAAAPGVGGVAVSGSIRSVAAHVAEASDLGPDCLPPQISDGPHLPTTSSSPHITAPRREDPDVPPGPALPVAHCEAAGHPAAAGNAAAAGTTADQQAVTTTTGTAGNGQQQHKQTAAAAQGVEPSAPRSRKRKQPEAEAEAEVAVPAASQPAAPAAAAVAEGRTKRHSKRAGAARTTKRQRTMAAVGRTMQAALASNGSTGPAATAISKKGRAALARKTAAPARPASAAASSAGRRHHGGRKQGRKTAKCIEERQEIYNRRESSRALSKLVGDNQSTVHRHKKKLQLKELLKTPAPPKSKEPFKRVISKGNRRDCRLLLSGEQLFHTGLLLGETLRLSVRVGGRQLPDLECNMQEATGQFQPQEAWIKALLDELEESSPLQAPYTLVLQRRKVQGGVAQVDASLEAQQQNQQQWWRGLQHYLPGVPLQQHEPRTTPSAVAEATSLAAAGAAGQSQQPVQQQAQQGAAPRLAAAAHAGAAAASRSPGTADQLPTPWRKHLETTPPGGCWLCKACWSELEGLQRAEQAQRGAQVARPPWHRKVNATVLKRVLYIRGKHLSQSFGWVAAMKMPPRMSLHVSGRMLRDGTASVMDFNKEGRDGFPFKARWLGMLLDALGAQLDDNLVLQHRFTTAAGVMHVAASLERAQPGSAPGNAANVPPHLAEQQAAQPAQAAPAPQQTAQAEPAARQRASNRAAQAGQAAQQAAKNEATPQPSWTPSDIANYTAGCRSDFVSMSSDARHRGAAERQEAGEEVEQPGRQKRRRIESAAKPREAAAAVVEAQPSPLAAPLQPAAAPAEQGQQAMAWPVDPGAAAAMQPPVTVAVEDGTVASMAPHPPAAFAPALPGRATAAPQPAAPMVLPVSGNFAAQAPALLSQATLSAATSTDPGSVLTAVLPTRNAGLPQGEETAAAAVAATAAKVEDRAKFTSPCGKRRYVYERAMRTHASTCPECQAKMRQREGQQRVGSMAGAAGSGAALDTLCDAAEMEMDACRGGTEPTEQATMVRDGGQPVAAVAGMQSNPVGGMPGPSPQLQGEATVARAPGSAHTAEVAASAPPLQQLKGQAPTAPAPNHAAGPSASAPPPPQLQEQASAALASNDAAGPAALAPLSSQLRGQSAAAQALNHVAEPLASAPPPPQVQGQATAAQVAEQVAGLPASMLQPPQLRGQAGAAWAAEQVAGPPPSVPPLLQATQGAPVVPSAQQPIVPAKAAQLNPALPTIDTLRRRLQQTPVDHATVEAYLAEWAAMPPSVQAGEWQVLKEYIKTDDMASLEVHVRSML